MLDSDRLLDAGSWLRPLIIVAAANLVGWLTVILTRRQSSAAGEPYAFDHVELNRLAGEVGRPRTEWMNMSVHAL